MMLIHLSHLIEADAATAPQRPSIVIRRRN